MDVDELALRASTGDEQAFKRLMEIERPYVERIIHRRLPEDFREDVQQDIWLALLNGLPGFRGESSFTTWFRSLCSNRIADTMRKYYREDRKIAHYEIANVIRESGCEPDVDVTDIIAELPPQYREVFIKRYVDDLNFREISESSGVHHEAIRSSHRRGLAWLRNHPHLY